MYKILLLLIFFIIHMQAQGQQVFTTHVSDRSSGKSLSGVTITMDSRAAALTDRRGYAKITGIVPGSRVLHWSHRGYETYTDTLSFPFVDTSVFEVALAPEADEMETVIVQSTRTGRSIAHTPTRVEIIDGEELDEKNNMRPANVSMLLHESTGIQVQQTSAMSGNASLRIQGLDGRYTQLLKDGYPNYGNFANGLSILEIPPLDLRQVEVIKGPASTLYGGGAIAGVVNFISREPDEPFEGDLLLNQSSVGQTNLGAYFSGKGNRLGYTVLGLLNLQKAYDVDKDDFSELPRNQNFTIHPRLYWYPDASTRISLGNSLTAGSITGGHMEAIDNPGSNERLYFEENKSFRNISTLEALKDFKPGQRLKLKQSLSIFNREIALPDYRFSGRNINSYTDLSYLFTRGAHTIIGGANYVLDQFRQPDNFNYNNRSQTAGLYIQDSWDLTRRVQVEAGLRTDRISYRFSGYNNRETFLLPRIAFLFRWSQSLSSRIGAGMGYKMPTLFTEQTESMFYRKLLMPDGLRAEKSTGLTADMNYRGLLSDEISISFNQLFFWTRIQRPLLLAVLADSSAYHFQNARAPVTSAGFETNLKLIYREDLKLFAGYTLTDAHARYLPDHPLLPLTPRHKINLVLMYEKEDNFKLGLEGYNTGSQYLYDGSRTPAFWELGFMAQKTFHKISVFINFENFTDERQSRYKRVVNGTAEKPVFDDIWNHTEGRVINGGIKVRL
ncbi:TonB-dependent receptor [Niabella terrae]